jgi:toxin CcdB
VAQFDVLPNPGRQREAVPFVVVLQNVRFDRGATRFVAPLVLSRLANIAEHYLAPRFTINGTEVVMDVFNLATLPADRLGAPVASLADEESRSKLIRALDEFLSQA